MRLTSGGVLVYNGATQTGAIESDGDFKMGSDISAASTTSFAVFSNNQTYNGESVGAGDLLIGDNSANKPNMFWDSSASSLYFRRGTSILSTMTGSTALQNLSASVYHSTVFTVNTGVLTDATFTNEYWDDANYWTVSDPTKLTVPYTGRYMVSVRAQFGAGSTSGYRDIRLEVNDSGLSWYLDSRGAAPT